MIQSLVLAAAVAVSMINPAYSPDSARIAYTDADHNLCVMELADSSVTRLTSDGDSLTLNGYASWVYYEEIFGRPSNYCAFWWSPDSRKVAFYRFDNTGVPMFPIYREPGQNGYVLQTRYPKAGQKNPEVKVMIADVASGHVVEACFEAADQYFGTPFWHPSSKSLYVPREPRLQNELDICRVDSSDGSVQSIYHESCPTWVEWPGSMLFSSEGLYMVRSFETLWEQIYFLSYDGKTLRRLTDGRNWRINLLARDSRRGDIWFTAHRDSQVYASLFRLDRKGRIFLESEPGVHVRGVDFSDGLRGYKLDTAPVSQRSELISLEIDGMTVPGRVVYPDGFDPSRKYPAVMEIYGGPNTPYVRGTERRETGPDRWMRENGVIKYVVDSRVAGHNGRAGTDLSYLDVVSVPVHDFCRWAEYIGSLPFVDESRIGVEGFSFGGTMTAMLVMTHPELFRCGVAGGGVYDWTLYDTHYTERFMSTPQLNPEGYARARVLDYVSAYDPSRSFLKLTHGTADDNVHFQNTLQLIDALQRFGKQFELMIYPGGKHGYRDVQRAHDEAADIEFWKKHLID